jgi:hypothetical protein
MWWISVIFQKMPKANNRPLGENSPNLITLVEFKLYFLGRLKLLV